MILGLSFEWPKNAKNNSNILEKLINSVLQACHSYPTL